MSRFLAIVDPWEKPLEHDVENYPFLASDIDVQCKLIHNQLSRLKPLFDDIIVITSGIKAHPIFDELPNYPSVMHEYISLDKRHDWDMWLCGFHYGRCIHAKIDEVKNEFNWSPNRFNVIQNLSFAFPKDAKRAFYKQDWMIDIAKNVNVYDWDYVDEFHLCGTNAIYVWDMDR